MRQINKKNLVSKIVPGLLAVGIAGLCATCIIKIKEEKIPIYGLSGKIVEMDLKKTGLLGEIPYELDIIIKAARNADENQTFYRVRKIENSKFINEILSEGDTVEIKPWGPEGPYDKGPTNKEEYLKKYPGLRDLTYAKVILK